MLVGSIVHLFTNALAVESTILETWFPSIDAVFTVLPWTLTK